jgi:hypothetical protein
MALLAVGCVPPGEEGSNELGVEVPEIEESSGLALMFSGASEQSGVPVDVLKALAYVETQFEPAIGEIEFEGQPEPYGLFALGGDRLDRAAALAGIDVEIVKTDDRANIDAAAALLRALADETGVPEDQRHDPLVWGPALSRWIDMDEEMAAEFSQDVLVHVRRGAAVPLNDGTTIIIGRFDANGAIASDISSLGASGTVWRPSPNHSSRNGSSVQLVVIHTCEGGYSGCVSWLRNTQAGASAHYVVKENGGEVSQLVDENRKAWHIAANYRPSLNGDRLPGRSGQSTNNFSIGIEHGGRASQSSWPSSQIDRSVSLVRDITGRHSITRDRYHIVAHGRLQPENRTDPGPNWPWTSYIADIAAGSGGGGGGGGGGSGTVITVDNTTSGRFRASGNWDTSSWASGKVGANYRYRNAQAVSDTADYKVNIATGGRYEVFARVPGNGYSGSVPYIIHHQGGRSIVHRDISSRGASWVSLGTYTFSAKDDWIVQISCWTTASGYLIADAIRLEAR